MSFSYLLLSLSTTKYPSTLNKDRLFYFFSEQFGNKSFWVGPTMKFFYGLIWKSCPSSLNSVSCYNGIAKIQVFQIRFQDAVLLVFHVKITHVIPWYIIERYVTHGIPWCIMER